MQIPENCRSLSRLVDSEWVAHFRSWHEAADPDMRAALKAQINKTDCNDARCIAQMMRVAAVDRIVPAYTGNFY